MSHPNSPATTGPVAYFTADHLACDADWAALEQAEAKGPEALAAAWATFEPAMRRHFAMEEDVLFPAFESATGMTGGPTAVMRHEHQQMRGLLDQMAAAAREGRWTEVIDHGDTLLMLVQQHNRKEEGMLYPMCQAHLAHAWPSLAEQLARY